ncbi:DUF6188 family protein [Nocardiopsis dassonvillei]|uniref:Uncharacterized protein n=1 Tax=Nocardiopsis dassonvillei (strain ATCC 23218 / DSM 43111 / CIP 107115 / JCM 7437 / KCTC 9190 / NBRC 14626 / NCTC 10488 / NRRL B-5397 / IMRU 509) TaxID=446468 RepID=D7AX76_NOCDD|nr:DUF6188 family protein [Nocardiopsis dassonvillei]ADH69846.1 hypothetical protein Ndas_4457 [Nocardiopsis dassonvillei subsp. dassonvillei DSM 43111]NKY78889.1 hypothetical protein [Nocardiopsis dassonvillei]VEI90358.1 Uncharacterised protein [Nocardiopsis dassonvillei]
MKIPVELVGTQVTRTAFDHQVRITFTGHGPGGRVRLDGELVIETTLSLTDAGGRQVVLTPGTGTCLAPLLGLFARTVAEVEITGRGTLRLVFDDGTWLSVAPDPDYESWGLTGVGLDPVLVGSGGEADWRR